MSKDKPRSTLDIKSVWLLTTGDGEDGSEWNLESIHETHYGVVAAKRIYERVRHLPDGSTYHHQANIEVWKLER